MALSAHVLSDAEAAALPVAPYLRKPINLDVLLLIVERYCRQGAARGGAAV